jgi:hypothetical protein
MALDDIKRAGIRDLLTNVLKENSTWRDLAAATAEVFETNIEDPIDQLAKIRWIRRDTDPKILENAARMLGFDLTQDVLYLNAENLTKIVTQLPHYPDHNSTRYFSNFIDMLLNAITDVRYLYTKDYVNFEEQPGGPLVIDGGQWFLTTHIELNLGLLHFDSLLLADGESLYSRVRELFYSFAPISLVIERFYFTIVFDDKDWVGGSALGIGAAFVLGDAELVIQ